MASLWGAMNFYKAFPVEFFSSWHCAKNCRRNKTLRLFIIFVFRQERIRRFSSTTMYSYGGTLNGNGGRNGGRAQPEFAVARARQVV